MIKVVSTMDLSDNYYFINIKKIVTQCNLQALMMSRVVFH